MSVIVLFVSNLSLFFFLLLVLVCPQNPQHRFCQLAGLAVKEAKGVDHVGQLLWPTSAC